MESFDLPECYDRDVATFLYGLNFSKYIELFNLQAIDLDIFLSLTDDDLVYIGVKNPEDRKALLQGISNVKYWKTPRDQYDETISLSDKDVLVIATNTSKQLTILHAALAYTRLRLKATPVRNMMYENHSAASLLTILSDEALSQSLILKSRLIELQKPGSVTPKPTRYAVKRRLGWTLFTASAIFTAITLLTIHFVKRRQ